MVKTHLTVLAATMCIVTTAHATEPTDFADCPRDVLRKAMLAAVPEEETPEVIAIEVMVMEECARRQKAFADLVENDRKLQELRNKPLFEEAEQEADLISTTKTVSEPEPLTGLFSEDNPYFEEDFSNEESTEPEPVVNAEPETPKYRYFSVYGLAGERKAGITDGSRDWHLSVGGTLPSGEVVTKIAVEPELVEIKAGGAKDTLSKGPAAGGTK